MKLSTKGKYGLIAIADLALAYKDANEENYVVLKTIAKKRNISEAYLERIVAKLKKGDLVKTQRGSLGGYCLAKSPKEIKISEVLYLLEGPLDVCGCGGKDIVGNSCEKSSSCISNIVCDKINEKIKETIENMTVEDILSSYYLG